MNIELLKDGCLLMVFGMGFVFIFIQLMIWLMELNAKAIAFINKFAPEIEEEDKYAPRRENKNNDAEVALAIACAYAQKRG